MGIIRTITGRNKFIVLATLENETKQLDVNSERPRTYCTYARTKNEAINKVVSKNFYQNDISNYRFVSYSENEFEYIARELIIRNAIEKKIEYKNSEEYLNLFARLIISYGSQSKLLRNTLEALNEDEIEQMLLEILSESIIFQRSFSEWAMKNNNFNDTQFFIAATWHLADALHNIPGVLHPLAEHSPDFYSMKKNHITRLCEYLFFIKALNELAPSTLKPNPRYYFGTKFSKYIDLMENGKESTKKIEL